MRIDCQKESLAHYRVLYNGKPIFDIVWADDAAGECEVYERHHWTGDLVEDLDSVLTLRTMRLKGKVQIIDDRPKIAADPLFTGYDGSNWNGC